VATIPVRVFSMSVTSRRLALLGLASAGVILFGVVIAAVPYRGHAGEAYSPLNHFISELGEVATSRLAWAFNLGIILGGIGLGTFVFLLADRLGGRFRVALVAAGLAAGVSGTLVGVFTMDYLPTHRIVSGIFFLTAWLVAGVFSTWLLAGQRPGWPRWLLVPGGAVTAMFLAFLTVFSTYRPPNPDGPILSRPDTFWSVPFLEWAALLSLLAWFVCVSLVLLRQSSD
jgi:hypothetical membrane protein